MKVLILNGVTDDPKYTPYTKSIEEAVLACSDHEIDYFRLKDMTIHYCTGCWSCWNKTPGYCSIKDDHEEIVSRIPNADLVLYISPIILGYESALMKKCKDRSIPSAHPYIKIHEGEQHHHQRYPSMPNISALLINTDGASTIDQENIENTYKRMALNFNAKVLAFDVITEAGGALDVINRI